MRNVYYKLDENHIATPCEIDDSDWLNNRVAFDQFDNVQVSTVFLNLDHNFYDDGPPLLFETMIFNGEHDQYQERCSTWEQALEMHATAVKLVNGEQ